VVALPLPLDLRERQRARVPAPPPWFDELFTAVAGASLAQRVEARAFQSARVSKSFAVAGNVGAAIADVLAWPVRCYPVCLGTVTVFRRTCCCWPLVIDDPRIPGLIRDLGRWSKSCPSSRPASSRRRHRPIRSARRSSRVAG
jgi:hypothetical protein